MSQRSKTPTLTQDRLELYIASYQLVAARYKELNDEIHRRWPKHKSSHLVQNVEELPEFFGSLEELVELNREMANVARSLRDEGMPIQVWIKVERGEAAGEKTVLAKLWGSDGSVVLTVEDF